MPVLQCGPTDHPRAGVGRAATKIDGRVAACGSGVSQLKGLAALVERLGLTGLTLIRVMCGNYRSGGGSRSVEHRRD